MRRIVLFVGLAVSWSGIVSAQVTIVKGAASNGLARTMNNNDNSFAYTADGAMWAVLYDVDATGQGGHLELRRSATHGVTWFGTYPLPNNTSHNNHHNNSNERVDHPKSILKAEDASHSSALVQAHPNS